MRAAAAALRTDLAADAHADELRALARDADGATRAAALRNLSARFPGGAREVLLAALQDSEPAALSAAARGLLEAGERQAHAMLCAVARNAEDALARRLAALEALEAAPREWSVRLWRELLSDLQGAVRLTCLRALCRAGEPEAGALLTAVLRGEAVPAPADPVPPQEPGGRPSSGQGRDDVELVEHPHASRERAAPRSTLEALLRPPPMAAHAGQKPALVQPETCEREWLEIVEENLRDVEQRRRARQLPVHMDLRVQAAHLVESAPIPAGREVVASLIAMLAATETALCVAAAEALGRLAAQDAVEALSASLDSLDPELRLAAVRSLGSIGHSDGLQAVRARWPDRDPLVRQEQVRVLGATSHPDGPVLARQALADPDPSVVRAAATLLLERGHAESVDDVLAALCRFPDLDWSGLGQRLPGRAWERASRR